MLISKHDFVQYYKLRIENTLFFLRMFCKPVLPSTPGFKKKEVSRGFSYTKGPKALIDLNLNQFPDVGDATREKI